MISLDRRSRQESDSDKDEFTDENNGNNDVGISINDSAVFMVGKVSRYYGRHVKVRNHILATQQDQQVAYENLAHIRM